MSKQFKLESFSSSWSELYEQECARVLTALGYCTEGGLIWRMAHVGSTALITVPAQPCIDIALDVHPVPLNEKSSLALESLGYQNIEPSSLEHCEVLERFDDTLAFAYRLFVTSSNYAQWSNMLILRDYLNSNLEIANNYANLKLEFEHKFTTDSVSYEDAKANFFKPILPRAYDWHINRIGFQPVIGLAEELSELEVPWHISGGWALDLFLTKAGRYHDDLDITIERQYQLELQAYLLKKGWTLHFIEEAKHFLWKQDCLLPTDVYQIHARKSKAFIDILLEPDTKADWLYLRDERVKLDKKKAVLHWQQIPFLAPEAVLLFKAKIRGEKPREKDISDFLRILPFLSVSQKNWLKRNIQLETTNHPWLYDL